jgi:hypothetical protein
LLLDLVFAEPREIRNGIDLMPVKPETLDVSTDAIELLGGANVATRQVGRRARPVVSVQHAAGESTSEREDYWQVLATEPLAPDPRRLEPLVQTVFDLLIARDHMSEEEFPRIAGL